jgi:hypothetical protein
VLTALTGGDRFGIILITAKSVARHRRYLRQMGPRNERCGNRSGEGTVARMDANACELVA